VTKKSEKAGFVSCYQVRKRLLSSYFSTFSEGRLHKGVAVAILNKIKSDMTGMKFFSTKFIHFYHL
jgi:hypothetical protein